MTERVPGRGGPGLGTPRLILAAACRLAVGAVLALCVARAVLAPETGLAASLSAVGVFGLTLWRPAFGLTLAVGLVSGGALLAAAPARAAELVAWTFLAGWLLRLRHPLASAGWPRAVVGTAVLYAAGAAASWVAIAVGGAAGVSATALPAFLVHAIPADYLIFSVPETETWAALQLVTGVGVFIAAAAIARGERTLASWIAWAIVIALAVLAAAGIGSIARQWAATEYGLWFLERYMAGERYSLHLADVNAAGSQYVLAGGIAAALVLLDRRARPAAIAAIAAIAIMLPALWLTGSRTAALGALAAAAAMGVAINATRVRWTRRHAAVAVGAVLAVLAVGALLAQQGGTAQGSAGRAMSLRAQFAQTSVRMFASAPVYGVGVGRYFERSPAFMPNELRALYGAENAHNYFAQTFAEMGAVGGLLFLWCLATAFRAGWHTLATGAPGAATIGLFAGCTGYLVTCLTGHPLLVAEAAFPFWVALGALASGSGAGTASGSAAVPPTRRAAGATAAGVAAGVAVALLVGGVVMAAVTYARPSATPPERGFDRPGVDGDGTPFRWMSPHVVTYTPGGSGFLHLTIRAPDLHLSRPMVVETAIGGRVVDRREMGSDAWATITIPVREGAAVPFRRVDVRVTPAWDDRRTLAGRSADVHVALTAMVRELRWERAGW